MLRFEGGIEHKVEVGVMLLRGGGEFVRLVEEGGEFASTGKSPNFHARVQPWRLTFKSLQ